MPSEKKPPPELHAEVIGAMERHVGEAHPERDFKLERDVNYEGNTSPHKIFDWVVRWEGGPALVYCALCPPGQNSFVAGDPFATNPERNAMLRAVDPRITPIASRARSPEDQRWLQDEEDRGQLGSELRGLIESRRGRADSSNRTAAKQGRLDRFRAYFLPALEREGSIQAAVKSLSDLGKSDSDAYAEVMGTTTLFGEGTFMTYVWECTTPAERQAAKKKWKLARDAQRAARREETSAPGNPEAGANR